jgi:biopolymer transport protein ExbD
MATLKTRMKEAGELDITPMIDMVFQLIIFFMVVMSIAVVYGVAIKFPPPGQKDKREDNEKKEKHVNVYVAPDLITKNHVVMRDGVVKVNGEEIALTDGVLQNYVKWEEQREDAFGELQKRMQKLVEQGHKSDVLFIQGEMKSYHGKIMRVIDRGKRISVPNQMEKDPDTGEERQKMGFDGFSLVPPQ